MAIENDTNDKLITLDNLAVFQEEIDARKQDTLPSGSDGQYLSLENGGITWKNIPESAPLVSITYVNLKALRDNGTLVPGQQYRITDYQCTTTQSNTSSAGHQFDIIVTADSTNKLNEVARACLHSGDTYFANSKLEAWRIWYCLDNYTNRFVWADSTNGKGVIYRMIDEFNNDIPYDFKNIQFKRYKITECQKSPSLEGRYLGIEDSESYTIDSEDFIWCYTFTGQKAYWNSEDEQLDAPGDITGETELFDLSAVNMANWYNENYDVIGCVNNKINMAFDVLDSLNKQILNNIVFTGWFADTSSLPENYEALYADSILQMMNVPFANTFGNSCYRNTFGNSCSGNTFGNSCYSNMLDSNCIYISLQSSASGNHIQNVHIHSGVKGTSSTPLVISVPVKDQDYSIDYYAVNSKEIILGGN